MYSDWTDAQLGADGAQPGLAWFACPFYALWAVRLKGLFGFRDALGVWDIALHEIHATAKETST